MYGMVPLLPPPVLERMQPLAHFLVLAGFTEGNVSQRKFDGIDKTVLDFVLMVSVVLAFRVLFSVNSFTSSSLLVMLGCLCKNFLNFRVDLSIVFYVQISIILLCSNNRFRLSVFDSSDSSN